MRCASRERAVYLGVDGRMIDDSIEARFIERLRARDERAFNELVKQYERRVFGLLLRLIGRRDEGADLAQEGGVRSSVQSDRRISRRSQAFDVDLPHCGEPLQEPNEILGSTTHRLARSLR